MVDAFGNVIGESLASQSSSSGYNEAAFSAQEDARDAEMARILGVGPVPQTTSGGGNFWGTSSGLRVTGRGGIGLRVGEQRASDEGAALQALFEEHNPQGPEPVLVADASGGMSFLKQAMDDARQGWNREYRSVLQGPSALYDFTKSSRELLGTMSGYDATNRGIAAVKEGDYLRGTLNVIQGFAEAGTTVFGFGVGNAGAGLRVGTSMSAGELAAVKATYVGSTGTVEGAPLAFRLSESGPTTLVARDLVSLTAQRRLNALDGDVGKFRPGEAGVAAEMENYLGGTLARAPAGTSADFVVESGPFVGARIDLKLTPDTFEMAAKLNKHFDQTFPKFSESFAGKLANAGGVDLMPFDTRSLTASNAQRLFDFVGTLPLSSQKKVIYLVR